MPKPGDASEAPFLEDLPNEIIVAALGPNLPRTNISALARAFGVYTCKVWHYFRGRNRWPAEEWLKTLIVIGAVHEGRKQFEIYLPKTPELCRAVDKLRGQKYLRGPSLEEREPIQPPEGSPQGDKK